METKTFKKCCHSWLDWAKTIFRLVCKTHYKSAKKDFSNKIGVDNGK